MEHNRNKVLIVDDEKVLRVGLSLCLRNAGFETMEAGDGEEALSLVDKCQPVLIILDVMMHGISGLEVCRQLRNNPRTKGIKIVFLSAKGQLKERAEGMEAGGDYYITKPFNYRDLINVVQELLQTG